MSESITSLFDESVAQFKTRGAFQFFSQKTKSWGTMSWEEVAKIVNKLAHALKNAGVKKSDRIAIISETRPEWIMTDLGILKAHGVVVPIYQSSLSDQVSYILADAEAKIVFAENDAQVKKIRETQKLGMSIDKVIVFDQISGGLAPNEVYFEEFIAKEPETFTDPAPSKEDIASLVYTSGTTGEPKGAMVTHDNFLYEALVIERLGILSEHDIQLLFLPLAHIFARVLAIAWIRTGHLLAFAQSPDALVDNMGVVQPTFMAGVPRIFEKVRAKVVEKALASGGIKARIARMAFHEASLWAKDAKHTGIKLCLAKNLVFKKIGRELNARFGGRLRFFVSGGAPLSSEVAAFFTLANVVLCEGYGLTETTAATCLNLPSAMRRGTVGKAVTGTEVKLDVDGEILVRGRGVFKGYWKKEPDTREVLGLDGWFRTGDIGAIDHDGYVKIVDRKKDIIVTSQGKNVAPARVENAIKSKSPVIAQVVVIGDKKPYLTALIALDHASAKALVSSQREPTVGELATHTEIFDEVKRAIDQANVSLASFEQIKRFHIVDREFEIGKELTPTLKVKRKYAIKEFANEVNALYMR